MKRIIGIVVVAVILGFLTGGSVVAQDDAVLRLVSLTPETVAQMKQIGIPVGPENARYDVFVIADASETNFSGGVLTKQIQDVIAAYPNDVRVWYVHFVLAYRDSRSDVLVSSGCLAAQQAFWPNIRAYVENDAKPYPSLGLYPGIGNQEEYADCVANENNPVHKQRVTTDKVIGQSLLPKVDAAGIPSTVFVDRKKLSGSVLLQGGHPAEQFLRAVELLKTQDGASVLPPSENKLPATSSANTPKTSFARHFFAALREFWVTLISYWKLR